MITARKFSYDGILRNSRITKKNTRLDIGFVEVKPARTPYPKDSAEDRLKVIRAMRSSLLNLMSIVDSGIEKIVVVGVICNGLYSCICIPCFVFTIRFLIYLFLQEPQ